MYPDLFNAQVGGEQRRGRGRRRGWIDERVHPEVAKRGAAIIEARGASSAASAANAAIDHVRDWVPAPSGDWVSMGVPSDGCYGFPEGLICGFPCPCAGGECAIVEGLELTDFSRERSTPRSTSSGRARRRREARPGLAPGPRPQGPVVTTGLG